MVVSPWGLLEAKGLAELIDFDAIVWSATKEAFVQVAGIAMLSLANALQIIVAIA